MDYDDAPGPTELGNWYMRIEPDEAYIDSDTYLTELFAEGNGKNLFNEIPDELFNYQTLIDLSLVNGKMNSISKRIGDLKNLENLELMKNNLTKIPSSIGKLSKLEVLNLSNNPITMLPSSIGNLVNLAKLNLGNTLITTLPLSISKLTQLNELIMPDSFYNIPTPIKAWLNSIKVYKGPNRDIGRSIKGIRGGGSKSKEEFIDICCVQ